jgi:hypothetical protein
MRASQANELLSEAAGFFCALYYPIFNNVGRNQINIHYHLTIIKLMIIVEPKVTVNVHETVPPSNFVWLAVFTAGVGFAM